jgi:hypothetical protein
MPIQVALAFTALPAFERAPPGGYDVPSKLASFYCTVPQMQLFIQYRQACTASGISLHKGQRLSPSITAHHAQTIDCLNLVVAFSERGLAAS